MKTNVVLTDEKAAEVAKIAELFGISNDECIDRLLTPYVFKSCGLEVFADDVEQIVCQTRSQAEALAKRLERFVAENRQNEPTCLPLRTSVVQDEYGWGIKCVWGREEAAA